MYEQTIDFVNDTMMDSVASETTTEVTAEEIIETTSAQATVSEETTTNFSIYDKDFKDYTVTESYLLIIVLLVVMLIITCFASKRR